MAETWPLSLCPQSMDWGLVNNDRSHTSPLSYSQQVIEMPGAYWRCVLRFDVLTRDRERELTALLGRMRGRAGMVDVPAWTRRRSDNIGAPVVVSAPVYAYQISVSGLTASTAVFRAGDYITISGEMFEVVENVNSNASGAAVIPVNKRVRATIPPGSPIEYRLPYCRMRRVQSNYSVGIRPIISGTSIELREAF